MNPCPTMTWSPAGCHRCSAGDALGEFVALSDRRLTLPSRGHLEPVRVCLPCSYRICDF